MGETFNTTGGDKNATGTPVLNDLVVVLCGTTGISGGTTGVSDNNSDGLGSYTQIGPNVTQSTNSKVLNAWVRNSLIGSATSTTVTATQTSSTGGGLKVLRLASMTRTGIASVYQYAYQNEQSASTTPAPVFGGAVLTGNPVVGAVVNGSSPAALTPRSSPAYTERMDTGYTGPTTGMELMTIDSGETAATITWGSTSASVYCDMVIEFNTAAYGTAPPFRQSPPSPSIGAWVVR